MLVASWDELIGFSHIHTAYQVFQEVNTSAVSVDRISHITNISARCDANASYNDFFPDRIDVTYRGSYYL